MSGPPPSPSAPSRGRGLAWSWSAALLGAAYGVPAALVALHDPTLGAAFAVGVIPPAVAGLRPHRRDRRATAVLGVLVGAPVLAGSLLAGVPLLAVVGIFLAGVGAAALARRARVGALALSLSLPMIGVGLSYTDIGTALGLAAIMVGGAGYAAAVSMVWPERPEPGGPAPAPLVPTPAYGVLLGATGATAAAIGFALDLDHVGWACAAALLVIRPAADVQLVRTVGRLASVALGAVASIALVHLDPDPAAYSVAIVLVVSVVAATRASRWYITSGFTTFLVFLLLLVDDPGAASSRFGERVGETVLGVVLAAIFGLVVPRVAHLATLQAPTSEADR